MNYYNNETIDYMLKNDTYGLDGITIPPYEMSKIRDILINSETTKNCELDLSDYRMNRLPKKLKSFVWLTKLIVSKCGLISLENLPPNLVELEASYNKINYIGKIDWPESLQRVLLDNNVIMTIDYLPPKLKCLGLSKNKISNFLTVTPHTLELLDLSKNLLKKVPHLNDGIKGLDISENYIEDVNTLPDTIEMLDCSKNEIKYITFLPKNITHFTASNNKITSVVNLPDNIQTIDLSNNQLSYISLKDSCKNVDLSNNDIRYFNCYNLPKDLECLNLENNDLNIEHCSFDKNNSKIKFTEKKAINEDNSYSSFWPHDSDSRYNSYDSLWYRRYNPRDNDGYYNRWNSSSNISSIRSKYNRRDPHYIVLKKKVEI
ncbi:hypothetical protein Catovirus_1_918 [Catovirus CTV1]|uniref:Leucine-rich repeat protein n=1 Tax=Catovirus CTV1 TaxID=1977631 RepID=A0A1V0SB29_9VIRU|nr:hypothetical protein Catovirus_1_918 [Catovirus CTV1]